MTFKLYINGQLLELTKYKSNFLAKKLLNQLVIYKNIK